MNVKFESESQALDFVLLHLIGIESSLQELESRLIELQQAVTPFLTAGAGDEAIQEEPDPSTHLHSILGCWLRDRVSPLVAEVSSFTTGPFAARVLDLTARSRGAS